MNLFTQHPKEVNETYFQHLKKALTFSLKLLLMSCQALLHAFFPFLFVTTVSYKIKVMNDVLQKRKENS